MKAIVRTKYGSPDGPRLMELERTAPKDDKALDGRSAVEVTAEPVAEESR